MPGTGRVVDPNMPHHVVQRGHNRNAVFVDDGDYRYYLDTLGIWAQQLQVKVYAWCLMTNKVTVTVTREIKLPETRPSGRYSHSSSS
jgi:putative transposase